LSEGLPDRSDEAAEEGTKAHELLERCLKYGSYPQGNTAEDDAVGLFLTYVRSLPVHHQWWPEKRVDVPAYFNPPEPMYGTADFVGYDKTAATIYVVDLKFGFHVVEVEENEQLFYYAMMAREMPELREQPVELFNLTIIQPRAFHPAGPVRSVVVTLEQMNAFASKLMGAARATESETAPLKAGSHCVFCPAAAHCPELKEKAMDAPMGTSMTIMPPANKLPAPATLPTDVLADIADKLPLLRIFDKAVTEEVERRLISGDDVPGFALADKRTWRKWADPEQAAQVFEAYGKDVFKTELKSPAQMEILLGKKVVKLHADLITQGVAGKKVVRTGSPEALPSAQVEFPALQPGGE
jgi:hypothetical protein